MTDDDGEPVGPAALPLELKVLLTAAEAAALLSISERTLWTLMNEGRIPCVRVGAAVRYRRAALEEWAEREEGEAARAVPRRHDLRKGRAADPAAL